MSIWDDIKQGAEDLGGGIESAASAVEHSAGSTAASIGKAVAAPVGALWDLTTFPLTGTSFHKALHEAAVQGSNLVDPFTNSGTWTGATIGKAFDGMNYAWSKAVDEPLATLGYATWHASHEGTNDWGALFDGSTWSHAYQLAKQKPEGVAFGQALGEWLGAKSSDDPFNSADLGRVDQEHPTLIGLTGVGTTLGLSWFLDPTVVAGKLAGASRTQRTLHELGTYDRQGLAAKIGSEDAVPVADGKLYAENEKMSGRVAAHFNYIRENNITKRTLNPVEVYKSSPELQQSSNGFAIAGAMADAAAISDPVEALRTYKQVVAVAGGDPEALKVLHTSSVVGQNIAERLANIGAGGPLDLRLQALDDLAQYDPRMYARYQTQLEHLNNVGGDLDKFVGEWTAQIDKQLSFQNRLGKVEGQMRFLPGAHTGIGNRLMGGSTQGDNALRALGTVDKDGKVINRVVDKTYDAHQSVLDRADALARKTGPETTLFQRGLYQVPLLLAKPASLYAGVYTKAPKVLLDSMRQVHFNGALDTHAWGDSIDQIDAMLRLGRVDPAVHADVLGHAARATTEAEKQVAAQEAVKASVNGLMAHYSTKYGHAVDEKFIENLVDKYGDKARRSQATMQGTMYSAAQLSPETLAANPFYERAMRSAETAHNEAFNAGRTELSFKSDPHANWRVDQLDDEGTLWSLPAMSSQLVNKIMLPDIPLMDKALSRDSGILHRHLSSISQAWADESKFASATAARLAQTGSKGADRLTKLLENTYKGMDALLDAGATALRGWKFSVLFRLGFPQRVLADDHMRIATSMHWLTEFAAPSSAEALKDTFYNHAPSWVFNDGRRADALKAWKTDRMNRDGIAASTGINLDMTPEHLKEIKQASRILHGAKSTPAARTAAQVVLDRHDPDGYLAQWYARQARIDGLGRSIAGHKGKVSRLHAEADVSGVPRAEDKIAEQQGHIDAKTAERDALLEQQGALDDPSAVLDHLKTLDANIKGGWKSYMGAKRHLGDSPVKVDAGVSGSKNYVMANGAYASDGGEALRARVSSSDTYRHVFQGSDQDYLNNLRSGLYRDISPTEDHHLPMWADVLNHQARNAPEFMFLVRHPDATAADFKAFLAEHPDIPRRVQHFAKTPDAREDWFHRLSDMRDQYVPGADLREALASGPVTPKQLEKLFPDKTARPVIHGQALDANTSRSRMQRFLSKTYENTYKVLSEIPTDQLTRHPFFNAMYRSELKDLVKTAAADKAARGNGVFTSDDLNQWEAIARQRALGHVERTLWHVSAHSHAAHTMRFVSPFFAAWQEAMSRWWRLAQEHPDVLRKFQIAFDTPKRAGLVYDNQTEEPVQAGASISANHSILLKIPFLKDNQGVNAWLKKLGGGRMWSIRESGLNIVLQGGNPLNPGVGPLVTMPADALAKHYVSDAEIAKADQLINPYPTSSISDALLPSGLKKFTAYELAKSGHGNALFNKQFEQNAGEIITDYRLKHEGQDPNAAQFGALMDLASKRAIRDLKLMTLSSVAGFTPATPESKYSAVQQGWQRILNAANSQGKDYTWARDQFNAKYGEIYDALIYSTSLNPASLSGTPAEAGAVQRYKGLLGHLQDPRTARIVIGPAAAMTAKGDPQSGQYSALARQYLAATNTAPGSSQDWLDQKDPQTIARNSVIQGGWSLYDNYMNQITVAANQAGLSMTSSQVRQAKSAAVQQIAQQNELWSNDYASRIGNTSKYGTWLTDMRQIANSKQLTGDTERQDIQSLRNYLTARDAVAAYLQQRKAAGQSYTPSAAENKPIMQAFASFVAGLAQDNTYFDTSAYQGLIEFDPYVLAGSQ